MRTCILTTHKSVKVLTRPCISHDVIMPSSSITCLPAARTHQESTRFPQPCILHVCTHMCTVHVRDYLTHKDDITLKACSKNL